MRGARKNGTKKRRGRPATGQGLQIGTRWPEKTVATIDAWAAAQDDEPGRSEAIRRLVELGLKGTTPTKANRTTSNKLRAQELAAKAIDKIADPEAPPEERAQRQRRLTKGPEEFREVRVDRPKAKGK
jgi:hypothetical protein